MKKLGLPELFKTFRMIRDSGIKDDVLELIGNYNKGETDVEIDVETQKSDFGRLIIGMLIDNLGNPKVENWLYDTLATLSGKKETEIKDLGFNEIFDMVEEIAGENDLKLFSGRVAKMLQK